MRIVIENSGYTLQNLGDIAMLQVAVTRLHELWPQARLQVLTDEAELLKRFCPLAEPLAAYRQLPFQRTGNLLGCLYKRSPALKARTRRHLMVLGWTLARLSKRLGRQSSQIDDFMQALCGADLVVASGGGFITDSFIAHSLPLLVTLEIAARHDVPVALLGQGLGPVKNGLLLRAAQQSLSRAKLIALREERNGKPFLKSLGVADERIVVTGDDAIELAYNERPAVLGENIGVNIRLASYSGVDAKFLDELRGVLCELSQGMDGRLIPLPISRHNDNDVNALRGLLHGVGDEDGGENLHTPLDVAHQAGRCRVVITGSYHAGVFALSQGIPVVALVKSLYYADKFGGLQDQFGVGCHLIRLDEADWAMRLREAAREAWDEAPQVRAQLLQAAQEQIAAGQNTYRRLQTLLGAKKT